jgi:glycosyltransferase involved in cell wall biosynthesis
MRLLFVCERLPWPVTGGPAIRTASVVQGLSERGHEVELLAFGDPTAPVPAPAKAVADATIVESPGEATAAAWLGHDGGDPLPWSVRQRASEAMAAAVAERSREADVVVATKLPMAQYLEHVDGALRVYDALDLESRSLAQIAELRGSALTRLHAIREREAVERYESELARIADLVTAVSDADAAGIAELSPGVPVHTVPIGVEIGRYEALWSTGEPRIAFFGDLGWPPNGDAARHLCQDVLPLLDQRPAVVIAGQRPGRTVRELVGPGIEVTGPVASMADALRGDTIAVAPLRAGTGMRVKLLEAMAWGLPTVSSRLGAVGIDHGGALVEADGAEATAAALTDLLADAGRRAELSRSGRQLVAARYGHDVSAERMLEAIALAQTGSATAARLR